MPKDYLDNTKKEFTEADMFIFALNYMERFHLDVMADGCVDVKEADKFLTENIKKFKKEGDIGKMFVSTDIMASEPKIKWKLIAIDVEGRYFLESQTKNKSVSFWDRKDFYDKFEVKK